MTKLRILKKKCFKMKKEKIIIIEAYFKGQLLKINKGSYIVTKVNKRTVMVRQVFKNKKDKKDFTRLTMGDFFQFDL